MIEPRHRFDVEPDGIFCLYDSDTPEGTFGTFAPLVALWRAKQKDGMLPNWTDFSFEELGPWIGNMALMDIPDGNPENAFYRLFGGAWVKVLGRDLSGMYYRDVATEGIKTRVEPFVHAMVRERLIGYRQTSCYWYERNFMRIEILDLLLSDNGRDVSQHWAILELNDEE